MQELALLFFIKKACFLCKDIFFEVPSKQSKFTHFKDPAFLKKLGAHCRKIRIQKGYSIDRLSKEGEQLSTSVIHRLETGEAPVSISVLARYAEVLEVPLKDLVDFPKNASSPEVTIYSSNHPTAVKNAFQKYLPLYSMRAAAGYFGKGEAVEPKGWVEASGLGMRLDPKMFVVQACGESMTPKIQDSDFVVFRFHPVGSRQGKIVLAQYRGPADPETGGSYTIKKYSSKKKTTRTGEWSHEEISLSPLNRSYKPIVLNPKNEGDFQIIGEFVAVLKP